MRVSLALMIVCVLHFGCAGAPPTPDAAANGGPLFELPRHWELVDQRQGESLYQANLVSNEGSGRMLVGRLKLRENVGELDPYLFKLHNDLVARIQGEVNFAPFAEERLAWASGLVGYRTKMRGELGREAVVVEGITFSDGEEAYFHYGLFPESEYERGRVAYSRVLASFAPIQTAGGLVQRGLDLSDSDSTTSAVASAHEDGAGSSSDYPSLHTHLGLDPWGAERPQIESRAGTPLRSGPNAIAYRCKLLDAEDCVVVYVFEFGKLTHGGFLFEAAYEDPREHVKRYLTMTQQLSQMLGRPDQSAAIWSNPRYRNEGAKWGAALVEGDVLFGTVWDSGATKIVHSLRKNDRGEIEHRLLVSNDQLRSELQRQQQQSSTRNPASTPSSDGAEAPPRRGVGG